MPVFEDLDRLAEAVRTTLPDRKALSRLEPQKQSGCVLLKWHEHNLAVKLTGESFEVQGNNLLVTGVSRLLGSALLRQQRLNDVLSAIVQSLREAENLAATDQEKALALLASIKPPMRRLAGSE